MTPTAGWYRATASYVDGPLIIRVFSLNELPADEKPLYDQGYVWAYVWSEVTGSSFDSAHLSPIAEPLREASPISEDDAFAALRQWGEVNESALRFAPS